MRRLFFIPLLLSINVLYSQTIVSTFSEAKNDKSGTLVFVHNDVFGLTEYKSGQVTGLLVDVMLAFEDHVSKNHGISLRHEFLFTDNDFPTFLKTVKSAQGGLFGLGNVSIIESRKSDFSFSPPFLENVSLLITNKSVPDISSTRELGSSLGDKSAYVVAGTTNHARVKMLKEAYLPYLKIEHKQTVTEIMKEVANNQHAFSVVDLNYYLEGLSNRLSIKRHSIYDQQDDPFGILLPLESDWQPILTEFFNSGFLESSEYRQMIAKHLGNSALRLLDSIKKQ